MLGSKAGHVGDVTTPSWYADDGRLKNNLYIVTKVTVHWKSMNSLRKGATIGLLLL